MPTTEAIPAQTTANQNEVKPDFGRGAYSSLMSECYRDAMRVFRLESAQAEKFARQLATELGIIRSTAKVEAWTGKANKDGKVTLYEASKVKGVTMTNTLMAMKALSFANEAGKNGFSCGKTQWAIMPESELENYLLSL